MFEGVRAVNGDDWNVIAVARGEYRIVVNVDLFESEKLWAASAHDLSLCFVAEMAARSRVDDDPRVVGWFIIH